MYLQKGGPVGRGVALQLDDLVQAALLLALLHTDLLLLHQFLGDLKIMEIFSIQLGENLRLYFVTTGWVRLGWFRSGGHSVLGLEEFPFPIIGPLG